MELIRDFKNLDKNDVKIAGGKGASLGEMTKAGIPVPPGFVLLSGAFERFLEETDLNVEIDSLFHKVDHKVVHTVDEASEGIQKLILRAEMPKDIGDEIKKFFKNLDAKYVAVRSSATSEDSADAAWAGQLDSFLNTIEETLLEDVQKCWASLFTPRAIFYRFEKDLHMQKISVAVVVQKMINSELSGVAFSVHPVTEDRNQLIIEAGFGLGESIVSGQITPDSYVVEKEPRRILDINVNTQNKALYRGPKGGNEWKDLTEEEGSKQVLSEKQIDELSNMILKIEKHYGFPVDIEWAFESEKFYIVQSRPITTLKPQEQEKNTSSHVSTSYGNWNLVITRNMSFWHQYLSSLGHYFNTKDFGVNAKNEQLSITVNGTETHIFVRSENMQVYAKAVMEAVDSYEKIEKLKNKYEEFAKELVDSLERCDKNLTLENWEKFVFQYTRFTAGLFLTSVIGRAGVTELTQELKDKGYKEGDITEIVGIITYPEEHTPLFNSQFDLLQIAKEVQDKKLKEKDKKDRLQEWLGNHGYIPVNFNEEPWSIEDANNQLNDFLKKNTEEEINRLTNNHSKKASEAKTKLKEINNEEISTLAKALAEGTYLNEFRKNIFSRVSLGFRGIFAKIAKIGGSDNWRDCFYLTSEEMSDLLRRKDVNIEGIIKERKVVAIRPTDKGNVFINEDDMEKFKQYIEILHGKAESSKSLEAVKTIKGFTASKGNVKGIVKIILSSKDFHKLEAGDILVTTMTSVDFVPIMEKAAAFITNEGGITSHAAIVSRELDKPCIIGTQNATQVLKDGDLVEVDADKGIIKIIKKNI